MEVEGALRGAWPPHAQLSAALAVGEQRGQVCSRTSLETGEQGHTSPPAPTPSGCYPPSNYHPPSNNQCPAAVSPLQLSPPSLPGWDQHSGYTRAHSGW